MKSNQSWINKFGIPFILFVLGAVLYYVSPEEQTLGAGIKPVYVHVAFTWVGLTGYVAAAALGIWINIKSRKDLYVHLDTVFSLGFYMLLTGFLLSVIASIINWGGFPFREPRAIIMINILAVSLIITIFYHWRIPAKFAGIMAVFPILVFLFSSEGNRVALHPDNPVTSAPLGIKYSFYGMFFIVLLFAFWLTPKIYSKKISGK